MRFINLMLTSTFVHGVRSFYLCTLDKILKHLGWFVCCKRNSVIANQVIELKCIMSSPKTNCLGELEFDSWWK